MTPRKPSALRRRAGDWFGNGNLGRMRCVSLGQRRLGFITQGRFWIYQEDSAMRPTGVVINLTPKMRGELVAALTKEDRRV